MIFLINVQQDYKRYTLLNTGNKSVVSISNEDLSNYKSYIHNCNKNTIKRYVNAHTNNMYTVIFKLGDDYKYIIVSDAYGNLKKLRIDKTLKDYKFTNVAIVERNEKIHLRELGETIIETFTKKEKESDDSEKIQWWSNTNNGCVSGCNRGSTSENSRKHREEAFTKNESIRTGNMGNKLQREEIRKVNTLQVLPSERYAVVDNKKFYNCISDYTSNNVYSNCVDVHNEDEYKDMKCLCYDNGKAEVALEPTGNIVSVFKASDSKIKNFAMKAVKDAIEMGADRLDCYDINGVLPDKYIQAGMIPICKIRFNKEFAPENWNFDRDGEPDIVFMMKGISNKRYMDYTDVEVPYIKDSEKECAYDLALKYRDNKIDTNIISRLIKFVTKVCIK